MDDAHARLLAIAKDVVGGDTSPVDRCAVIRQRLADASLIEPLLESLIADAIAKVSVVSRANVVSRPAAVRGYQPPQSNHAKVVPTPSTSVMIAPRQPDSISLVAGVVMSSILDTWKLPGGKLLGDVKSEDLSALAGEKRRESHVRMRDAIFYNSLAQVVGEGKRVRDAITNQRAVEIFRSASTVVRVATTQLKGDPQEDERLLGSKLIQNSLELVQ